MLLFVVSALVVFHFALPSESSDLAAYGLLWVALVFTALLGLVRAFSPNASRDCWTGSCSRRATAARSGWRRRSRCSGSSSLAEIVALPAFAIFFHGIDGATVAGVALADVGICAVGTLLAAMAAASRARELLLPLLFLPLAIPIVVGGVGAGVVDDPGRYLGLLALYDAIFAIICWASFEYVVTE